MPKSYRHLFEHMTTFEALHAAYRRARRGKRRRPDVAGFEFRCEEQLLRLQEQLLDGSYRPGAYHSFRITENGKQRVISAAPFRDRVVHHALCAVLEPIWEPRFIHDSYASRPGKGTHAALDRAQHFARGHRFVLSVDVQQFFPSIDHALLRDMLARHVADKRVLTLIDHILAGGRETLRDEYRMAYFPGDDLFAAERPRGLPIGNQTSQFWANVFLHPLDMLAFARRFRRARAAYAARQLTLYEMHSQVRGWIAHARHGDTKALRRSLLRVRLPRWSTG